MPMTPLWIAELSSLSLSEREEKQRVIRTQYHGDTGPGGWLAWSAIDANTYDCDCDQDGFFSKSPIGWGASEADAIEDLKDQLEQNNDTRTAD